MKLLNLSKVAFTGELLDDELNREIIDNIKIEYETKKIPCGYFLGIFKKYETITTDKVNVVVETISLTNVNFPGFQVIKRCKRIKTFDSFHEAVSEYQYIINMAATKGLPKERNNNVKLRLV